MRAVILCGGRGTRALPHTEVVPKPLLHVAGEPVLAHVLRIYAAQGVTEFVLAAGYLADRIADFARGLPASWDVEVVDTGIDANTAERLVAVRHLLDGRFLANYADGLGDVDLDALVAFHASRGGAATLTSVPLPSPYGTLELASDGGVRTFREKPRLDDHRINGGYFVFEPRVLDLVNGPDLERDVLPAIAAAGELYAYAHPGFWRSMDTYKDAQELTELARGGAPWIRA
ncbi:MAG: sugar phosphate nucleotidyltransferase [Nitriliruptor sp.]